MMDNLDNLSVVACREQTSGRGQGDHIWHSAPGLNLTFSILLRFGNHEGTFPLKASRAIVITHIATLSIRDHLLSKGIGDVRIKWPNDIWTGDRKISGMLVENIFEGAWVTHSIVGIGLNVNEVAWPADLPNPVSMKELTGNDYDPELELPGLRGRIEARYAQASTEKGRTDLEEEFSRYMFRLPEGL